MADMKNIWHIKDLIDLEFFLAKQFREPVEDNDKDGRNFDRMAYLSFPGHVGPEDDLTYRKKLIRHWLEQKREHKKQDGRGKVTLPGDAFAEAMGVIRVLTALIALVVSTGLTWSLLYYQGREPVNVFTCLWVLVVPQVLLLLFLVLSAAFHNMRLVKSYKLVYPMLTAIVHGILRRIGRFAEKRMSAGKANRIMETYAFLGKTKTVYGSVFFWPIFLLAQLFGICFNVGVLSGILLKVAVTDLAFGWQTTLRLAPESVLRVVEIMALPWSWLFSPPIAHPTITQITGSQMILKDGIFHLVTADLVAWWPFIFLAVFFYGFLPRLLLAFAGFYLNRRAIESVDFRHGECDRLILRMKTPEVDTSSHPYKGGESEETSAVSDDTASKSTYLVTTPAIVLVPADIFDQFKNSDFKKNLQHSLGIQVEALIPVEIDSEKDSDHLKQVFSERHQNNSSYRTVIVQEAWQPPIKENISWIKSLRTAMKSNTGIIIALVGKPGGEFVFTPPSNMDRMIWEQAINGMGDPYIRTESFQPLK